MKTLFQFVVLFAFATGYVNNAIGQINSSEVFFYEYTGSEYLKVVKFNYSKSQMQIKSIKKTIVRKNLTNDFNYYEKQIWGDDYKTEAEENGKEIYKYDTSHRKYTCYHMGSIYDDNCAKCVEQCSFLRKYDDKATDCWGYGCGRHGELVIAITWVHFDNDMSCLYSQYESLKNNNEWYGEGKYKRLMKEDIVPANSKAAQSNTYPQKNISNGNIYFYQLQGASNHVVKIDPSKQRVYDRYVGWRDISKNLAKSIDYYENDNWTGKDVTVYNWDAGKGKYVHLEGERIPYYDSTCSVCRKNCKEAEARLDEDPSLYWGFSCEQYSCGNHGYYHMSFSYLDFSSDMQEMHIQYGHGKNNTLERPYKYMRMEKSDFKSKMVGSNKFPTNINLIASNGASVTSSVFLNKKPVVILITASWGAGPSGNLLRELGEVCDEWKNKYGAEIVTIDCSSDRVKRPASLHPCITTYFDEKRDFLENFLAYYFPQNYNTVPRILIVNKNNEMVYSRLGYDSKKREQILSEITQKLQEIK